MLPSNQKQMVLGVLSVGFAKRLDDARAISTTNLCEHLCVTKIPFNSVQLHSCIYLLKVSAGEGHVYFQRKDLDCEWSKYFGFECNTVIQAQNT